MFTPLINYAGYEHVLNAVPCFIHPGNHNVYGIAIEKHGDIRQDLSVYRVRPGSQVRELAHRFVGGGVDAQTQIAAGGCLIRPDGSLEVWASADPVGGTPITKTGFVGGFWPPIPGIDDPYPLVSALQAQIAALEARINALPPTTTGGTLVIPAQQAPWEGGEIILQAGDGGEPWHIDEYRGYIRLHRAGKVYAQWGG